MDFLLKYEGKLADENELDFYDAARAMAGFQRSLAITTHLVLNGEIITQAPSLKNGRITVATPRPGSWEVVACIVGGIWAVGTAGKDTPFGHLLYSVYDFVVSRTFGFSVDYDKSLYQSYQAYLAEKEITPAKLDSLAEKIEASLADMHRPIVASKTADHADIFAGTSPQRRIKLGSELNSFTYDHIKQTEISDVEETFLGVVSSYNRNTFTGRIFIFDEERPINFKLSEESRTIGNIGIITGSLRTGAIENGRRKGAIFMDGYRLTSSTGRLKAVNIFNVSEGV